MNRFKFRGWNEVTKKMISWNELINMNLSNIFVLPKTTGIILMQYTGLCDKNGKEIYEGDIIRKLVWDEHKYMETNNGQCYSYAQIQYIEELAGFYIVNCEGEICWELGQDKYNIEVIRKHI